MNKDILKSGVINIVKNKGTMGSKIFNFNVASGKIIEDSWVAKIETKKEPEYTTPSFDDFYRKLTTD